MKFDNSGNCHFVSGACMAPAKKYRGILFDLDGTLLDTAEGVLSSVRYTTETLGYEPLSDEVMRTFIGPPVKQSLIRVYGLDDRQADRATEIFRNRYKDYDLLKATPYPGILELLRSLRENGYKIGVATLKREDYSITLLKHYQIAPLCDSICGSDFLSKMSKADVIQKCLKNLSLSPEQALLVGDTSSDGTGAKNTGVDFMAVTYGFGPDSKEGWVPFSPVYTADNTEEIKKFLIR